MMFRKGCMPLWEVFTLDIMKVYTYFKLKLGLERWWLLDFAN